MTSFISSHNEKVSKGSMKNIKSNNCRNKNKCPLGGLCLIQDIVSKCVASTLTNPDKAYLRAFEGEFKKRHNSHT